MKIKLYLTGGKTFTLTEAESGEFAEAKTHCPKCKVAPLGVHGRGKRIGDDDRHYVSDAFCHTCSERIGTIKAFPSTIFGLEEDERILYGRCRVY